LRIRTRAGLRHNSVRAAVRVRFKRLAAITLGHGVRVSEGSSISGQPLVLGSNVPRTSPLHFGIFVLDRWLASGRCPHLAARRRETARSAPARWRSPPLRRPSHGGDNFILRRTHGYVDHSRRRNIQGFRPPLVDCTLGLAPPAFQADA
jgi:hypothetical protein